MTKLDAYRGADLPLSYIFPMGTDLSGATSQFRIYEGLGRTELLSVGGASTAAGSHIAIAANILSVFIAADDIDALPEVDAQADPEDSWAPAILYFDHTVTTDFATSRIHGGVLRVNRHGVRVSGNGDELNVTLDGQEIDIEVAASGFDTAVLTAALAAEAGAQAAAIEAARSASMGGNFAAQAAEAATAAEASAASANSAAATASGAQAASAGSRDAADAAADMASAHAAAALVSEINAAASAVLANSSAISLALSVNRVTTLSSIVRTGISPMAVPVVGAAWPYNGFGILYDAIEQEGILESFGYYAQAPGQVTVGLFRFPHEPPQSGDRPTLIDSATYTAVSVGPVAVNSAQMSKVLVANAGCRWGLIGNGKFGTTSDAGADSGYYLVNSGGTIGALTTNSKLEVYFDVRANAPSVTADALAATNAAIASLKASTLANNLAIGGNLDPAIASAALWHTGAGQMLAGVAELKPVVDAAAKLVGCLQMANCGSIAPPNGYTVLYSDAILADNPANQWYFVTKVLEVDDPTKFPTQGTEVAYGFDNLSITLTNRTHGFTQISPNVRRYWASGQYPNRDDIRNLSYGFGNLIAGAVAGQGNFTYSQADSLLSIESVRLDQWYFPYDIPAISAPLGAATSVLTGLNTATLAGFSGKALVTTERPLRLSVLSDSRAFGAGYLTNGSWLAYVEAYLLHQLAQTFHVKEMKTVGSAPTFYSGAGHYLGIIGKATGVNSGFEFESTGDALTLVVGKERGNSGAALIDLYIDGVVYDTFSTYNSEPFSNGNIFSGVGDGLAVKFDIGKCWTYNHVVLVGGVTKYGHMNTQGAGGSIPSGDDYMVIRQAVGNEVHHIIQFVTPPGSGVVVTCTYDSGENISYMRSYMGNTTKPLAGPGVVLESAFADGSVSFDTTAPASISSSVGFKQTDERAQKTWRFTTFARRAIKVVIHSLDSRAVGDTPELYLNFATNRLHRIHNAGLGGYDAGELLSDAGTNSLANALQFRPDIVFIDFGTNDDNSTVAGARTSSTFVVRTGLTDATVRNDESANYYDTVTLNGSAYDVHDVRVPITAISSNSVTLDPTNATFTIAPGDIVVLGDYKMDNRRLASRVVAGWNSSTHVITWNRPILASDFAHISILDDLIGNGNSARVFRNANFITNVTALVANVRATNPHSQIILGCPGMPNENYRSLEGYRELIGKLAGELGCLFCDHYGRTKEWQESQPANVQLYLDASLSIISTGASSYVLFTSAGLKPSATATMLRGWSVTVDGVERINNDCYVLGGKKQGFSASGLMLKTGPKSAGTILTGSDHTLHFSNNVPPPSSIIIVKYSSARWAADDTHPFTNGLPLFGQAAIDATQSAAILAIGKPST